MRITIKSHYKCTQYIHTDNSYSNTTAATVISAICISWMLSRTQTLALDHKTHKFSHYLSYIKRSRPLRYSFANTTTKPKVAIVIRKKIRMFQFLPISTASPHPLVQHSSQSHQTKEVPMSRNIKGAI